MSEAADPLRTFRTAWWQRLFAEPATYELTRFAVLRLLALVYLVAFLSLANQLDPLLGSHGLLPVADFLVHVKGRLGAGAYWRVPTLLWLGSSDGAMHVLCGVGVALSAAALLGATNALLQLALWAIYMSFVHVGADLLRLRLGDSAPRDGDARGLPVPPAQRAAASGRRARPSSSSGCCGGSSSGSCSARRSSSCATTRAGGTSPASTTTSRRSPTRTRSPSGRTTAPHGVHVAGVLFNHLAEARRPMVRVRLPPLAPRRGDRSWSSSRRRSSRAGTSRSSTGSPSSRRSRASTTRLFARLLPRNEARVAPRALRGAEAGARPTRGS